MSQDYCQAPPENANLSKENLCINYDDLSLCISKPPVRCYDKTMVLSFRYLSMIILDKNTGSKL